MNIYADKMIIHSRSGAAYNPPKANSLNYPPWGIGMLEFRKHGHFSIYIWITWRSITIVCVVLCPVHIFWHLFYLIDNFLFVYLDTAFTQDQHTRWATSRWLSWNGGVAQVTMVMTACSSRMLHHLLIFSRNHNQIYHLPTNQNRVSLVGLFLNYRSFWEALGESRTPRSYGDLC